MSDHRKFNLSQLINCLVLGLCTSAGLVFAEEPPSTNQTTPNAVRSARASRDALKDKQLDVSLETRDIERVLGKLKKASELAKQRISEAAETTEAVTTSLNKGDANTAQTNARTASEKFKEIVKQLEALLKEETAQQLAEAKQLASKLAKLEREFAEKFEGALNPGSGSSPAQMKMDPKSQATPKTDPKQSSQGNGSQAEADPADPDKTDATTSGSAAQPPKQEAPAAGVDGGDQPKPDSDGTDSSDANEKPGETGTARDSDGKEKSSSQNGKGPQQDSKTDGAGDVPKKEGGSAAKEKEQKPDGGGETGDQPERTGSEAEPDGSNGQGSKEPRRSEANRPENRPQNAPSKKSAVAMTAEELREAVARRADKLAEKGKTLRDVLSAIAQSDNPSDKDAAGRIQSLLKEVDLEKTLKQLNGVGGMVRRQKDVDAKTSSLDLADRFEVMSQRLDEAYRGIVAPQAEELRKIESLLIELREKLDELKTPGQVATWHRELRNLLDELDKLGVALDARTLLEKELKTAGFGLNRDPTLRTIDWGMADNHYTAPNGYFVALALVQEEVQTKIQTLLLGDFGNLSDESTPPMYQDFVDRYYQLLSGERTDKLDLPATKSERKPKGK